MLVAATVLALGRIAMGVLSPSDVLAGALLDTVVAIALYRPRARAFVNRLANIAGTPLERAVARLAHPLRGAN